MKQMILALFLLTYFVGIGKALFRFLTARTTVILITRFSALYGHAHASRWPDETSYQAALTDLMRHAPIINEMIRFPKLSYEDELSTTFHNAEVLREKLQMKVNEYRIQLYRSLNPFRTAKEIVVLPLSAVQECGFALKPFAAITVNCIGWLVGYLLSMFQPEIKVLLISLFQQLIQI